MEGKKISFGFMKTRKVEKPVIEEKKEFIECVEEQSIKVVGGETIEEKAPLIIPMKPNTLITAERLKKIAEEVESAVQEPQIKPDPETLVKVEPVSEENLSLDQLAVRELLEDAKKEIKVETQALTVPIPAQPVLDGQKESTLDDYESVPVQDFGLAMLRGMGWQPGKEQSKYKEPQLRPKGLGLGADKVVKENQTKNTGKDGDKELMIVKNAFVKITAGKHSGYYGKVVSLDEDNGRVMVDILMKKETVSLSEFMMQPVSKSEFDKQARVINADKYEEYKKKEQDPQKMSSKHDSKSRSERESTSRQERNEKDSSSRYDAVKKDRYERESSRNEREGSSSRHDTVKKDRYERESSRNEREGSSSRHDAVKKDRYEREHSRSNDVSKESREQKHPERTREHENSSNGKSRDKETLRRGSSSEDRSSRRRKEKEDKKRYSSNDSISSLSDSDKRRKHKETRKRHSSSSDSDSSDERHKKHKKNKKHRQRSGTPEKRDIDKKRKGKKKKRDRDRSPHYKKHRK